LDKSGRIDEIFIVDDDYDMREALSAIFRTKATAPPLSPMAGLSFAWRAIKRRPVFFLIYVCPVLQGSTSSRARRQELFGADPIISAQEDVLNVVQAMRNGAFDYLEKRLDAEAIVTRSSTPSNRGGSFANVTNRPAGLTRRSGATTSLRAANARC